MSNHLQNLNFIRQRVVHARGMVGSTEATDEWSRTYAAENPLDDSGPDETEMAARYAAVGHSSVRQATDEYLAQLLTLIDSMVNDAEIDA